MTEIVLFWIFGCIVAAVIASGKGRSVPGFLILAVFLSPIVGITAALIAKPNQRAVEKSQVATGRSKKCPYCAEVIKVEAIVCRYCGRDLPAAEQVPVRAEEAAQVDQASLGGASGETSPEIESSASGESIVPFVIAAVVVTAMLIFGSFL